MAGMTIETYQNTPETVEGFNQPVGFQAEKELNEAIQAIKAHEDAKQTVESTAVVAEKEMREAGLSPERINTGFGTKSSPERINTDFDTNNGREKISKEALQRGLNFGILDYAKTDLNFSEEIEYAFVDKEDPRINKVKQLNNAPETAKQIQFETGDLTWA